MNSTPFEDDAGWPEVAPAARSWRLGRVTLVVLGLLLAGAGGLWALEKLAVGFPAHPTTVDRVEAMLRESTPIGCSRAQVLGWIGSSGLDPDYSVASGESGDEIVAIIRDTYRSLVCNPGAIRVEWDFDRSGKLVRSEVQAMHTCL